MSDHDFQEWEGYARAEGYAAGLRDAARAVCRYCLDGLSISAGTTLLHGYLVHIETELYTKECLCEAQAIRRLAAREGISTEDW